VPSHPKSPRSRCEKSGARRVVVHRMSIWKIREMKIPGTDRDGAKTREYPQLLTVDRALGPLF
jgi:hypothetical protein